MSRKRTYAPIEPRSASGHNAAPQPLTSTDPDDPRADGFGADVPLPEAVVVNLDSHGGPGANQGNGDRDPLRRRIGSDGEVSGGDDDVAEEADA